MYSHGSASGQAKGADSCFNLPSPSSADPLTLHYSVANSRTSSHCRHGQPTTCSDLNNSIVLELIGFVNVRNGRVRLEFRLTAEGLEGTLLKSPHPPIHRRKYYTLTQLSQS